MAVFVRRNLTSFLVVLILIAAYPSEVRTKPTSASSTESDAASHDLEKVKPSKTNDSGFYINFDSDAKDLSEDSKTSKQVQKKKVEGSTEKSKQSKFEDATSEEKSKSKNQDSSVKAEKKSKKANYAPEDVPSDYTDEQTSGWDVGTVLAKDDSEALISSEQDLRNYDDKKRGSEDSSKDNETVSNKKSKGSKSNKSSLPANTEDDSESLPTPAGQRNLPTTTPPSSTTHHSSKGSASTNLPRALCSFVVTVCTVLLML